MVPGTQNQFCWGNCYLSTIFVSPNPLPVEALSLNDPILSGLSFHQILDPDYSMDPNNFAVGTSLIKYYAIRKSTPMTRSASQFSLPTIPLMSRKM